MSKKHEVTIDLDDYNVPSSIDIDLDDFEDEIMEWLATNRPDMMTDEKYAELRDPLHYETITQADFIEKLDAIFKYRRM